MDYYYHYFNGIFLRNQSYNSNEYSFGKAGLSVNKSIPWIDLLFGFFKPQLFTNIFVNIFRQLYGGAFYSQFLRLVLLFHF